jgi:4-hydroxy-tetrahydrodipicolinate reductase
MSGRMGKEVAQIISSSSQFELMGGWNRSIKNLNLEKCPDIIIDFSLPEALDDLEVFVNKYPGALVSGTTGFNLEQKKRFEKLGSIVPVFWSANMSFGVYLMCQLTEILAKYDQLYDFQIEETHHVHKKDKPSGTALIIQEAANRSTSLKKPINSHRIGEVYGEHRFIAASKNEVLEIRHEATSRSLFAQGALDISLWLIQQPNGFYKMKDFFQSLVKN